MVPAPRSTRRAPSGRRPWARPAAGARSWRPSSQSRAANAAHSRSLSVGALDPSAARAGISRSRRSSRRTAGSHSSSATAPRATSRGIGLDTFTPTPNPTHCTASPCQRPSHRIPASFRSPSSTSFGHLRRVSARPSNPSTASATASPTRTDSTPSSARDGRISRPSQTPPRGECHVRPSRPRPAVCSSAITRLAAGAPCDPSS